MSRFLKAGPDGRTERAVLEASRALEDGRVVAIPTETVYGLAASADVPGALEAVVSLKGRSPDKPFARLCANRSGIERLVGSLLPMAERIVTRFMPGPVTLVTPGRDGANVGIRVPENELTLAIIRNCSHQLFATSANPSQEPPATDARQVEAYFPQGEPSLILDDGPSRLGQATTVVRADKDGWSVLREGTIDRDELETVLTTTVILFVCTGNTCRSPMAEGIARRRLGKAAAKPESTEKTSDFSFQSAGTFACEGAPAAHNAVTAAGENAGISDHESRAVTRQMLREADAVYCMTRGHLRDVIAIAGQDDPRFQLLDPGDRDIQDPVGGDLDAYRECAKEIAKCIEQRMDEWIQGRPEKR
jgi:protein-tyrosine phosphatase